MSPLQTSRVALRALLRKKLRSFLTTLGIVIGVAAVIAMVAIGEGAKRQVEASFASMGANLLIVLPGTTTAGGVQGGFGSMPTLTWDDLAAIQRELPSVVLSDIGMSGENGYDLIRKVRALAPEKGGTVPAVALTAYAGPSDRRRALVAGFHVHLAKPVEPDELLAVIASLGRMSPGNE